MTPKARAAAREGIVTLDADGNATVRYERQLKHPVAKVWRALTDPQDPFGFFHSVDLRPGGEAFIDYGTHTDRYVITELEPLYLIEYRDDSVEPGGIAQVNRWELHENDAGCLLIFVTSIGPKAPAQLRVLVGWHGYLEVMEGLLDGNGDRSSLQDAFRAREKAVAQPYVKTLRALYPGWTYDR